MGEGGTPLVESCRIGAKLLGARLAFKLEMVNPTGSYKDRFIAAELEHLLARGVRVCVATSSGNTGASLAAYCARYGLACAIVVNADAPAAKLLQMEAHGARLLRVTGFATSPEVTEAVFADLREFTDGGRAALVVSAFRYCPVGMEGVKAIAREIVAQAPDVAHVFAPVGGGGLFAAVSAEMRRNSPGARVHAVQPNGCPTVLNAVRLSKSVEPVESATRLSGLSVPFDIDASLAVRMLREGGGEAFGVDDTEVFEAQREMLREEGIYCEPAGAAALAGARRAVASGVVKPGERCVCLVTGHGSKDTASVQSHITPAGGPLAPDAVQQALREWIA